jgi:hypothetical protein
MNPSIHPGVAEPHALKIVRRTAFQPTQENRTKVTRMSRLGIPQSQMANLFGIAEQTLRKHFRKELSETIKPTAKPPEPSSKWGDLRQRDPLFPSSGRRPKAVSAVTPPTESPMLTKTSTNPSGKTRLFQPENRGF